MAVCTANLDPFEIDADQSCRGSLKPGGPRAYRQIKQTGQIDIEARKTDSSSMRQEWFVPSLMLNFITGRSKVLCPSSKPGLRRRMTSKLLAAIRRSTVHNTLHYIILSLSLLFLRFPILFRRSFILCSDDLFLTRLTAWLLLFSSPFVSNFLCVQINVRHAALHERENA